MKRMLTLLLAVVLAVGTVAVTAFAEETQQTPDTVTSATSQSGNNGRNNRRQMPGSGQVPQNPGNTQNGQVPQAPDQNTQDGQVPQTPDQNTQGGQNNQQPRNSVRGGRSGMPGNRFSGGNPGTADTRTGKSGRHVNLDQLLADGVITQEVYDAIVNYLNEKAQQQAGAAAPGEGAEAPADKAGNPPVPEGTQESAELKLLKQLLDSGVITQEQYDLLAAEYTAAETADSI